MADEADRSEIEIENNQAAGIWRAGQNVKHLLPVGECYACGAWLGQGRIYCNNVCADEHAADLKRKQELGR
jgi:hypothetical protein